MPQPFPPSPPPSPPYPTKVDNAIVMPLVLQVPMDGGNSLPLGATSVRLPTVP